MRKRLYALPLMLTMLTPRVFAEVIDLKSWTANGDVTPSSIGALMTTDKKIFTAQPVTVAPQAPPCPVCWNWWPVA